MLRGCISQLSQAEKTQCEDDNDKSCQLCEEDVCNLVSHVDHKCEYCSSVFDANCITAPNSPVQCPAPTTEISTDAQCFTRVVSQPQCSLTFQKILQPPASPSRLVPSRSVAVLDRPPMRWNATRRKIAKRVPSRMGQPATRPSSRRIESSAWLEIPPISTVQIRPIAASRSQTMVTMGSPYLGRSVRKLMLCFLVLLVFAGETITKKCQSSMTAAEVSFCEANSNKCDFCWANNCNQQAITFNYLECL